MYYVVIDVMGIVEDLEPIQEFQTNHGPVEIIKFTIYDGRYNFGLFTTV